MAEQRIFAASDIDLAHFGETIERWFQARDLETQMLGGGASGVTVQARTRRDWRRYVGGSAALSVTATLQGENLLVQIGAAKWADKVGAGVAALILFWPLAALPVYGAYKQKQLIDDTFQFIENYIASGGGVPVPPAAFGASAPVAASAPRVAAKVACPSCGESVDATAKFCGNCGAHLALTCAECGASLNLGAKFCESCGAKVESSG